MHKTFSSKLFIAICAGIFWNVQVARSDNTFNDLYTLNLLNDSYCQGSGGSWQGMTCDRSRVNSSSEGSIIGAIIGAAVLATIFGGSSGGNRSNVQSVPLHEIKINELKANRAFDQLQNDAKFSNLEASIKNLLENKIVKIDYKNGLVKYYSILKGGHATLLREYGKRDKNDFDIGKELQYSKRNIKSGRIISWSIKFIGNIPNICLSKRRDGRINCYALEFIEGNDEPLVNLIGHSVFFMKKAARELIRWDYSFASEGIILGPSKINVLEFSQYATRVLANSRLNSISTLADSILKDCVELNGENSYRVECKKEMEDANQKYARLRDAIRDYQNFLESAK